MNDTNPHGHCSNVMLVLEHFTISPVARFGRTGMGSIYHWLSNRTRREVLGFVGTGMAVIIGAAWAVYTEFNKNGHAGEKSPPPQINQTVQNNPTITQSPQVVQSPTITNENNPTINVTTPSKPEPTTKIEMTFMVCQGEYAGQCPVKTDYFIHCDSRLEDFVAEKCVNLQRALLRMQAGHGGGCGYSVTKVTCTAGN
jgi:hypothetical protein